MYLTIKKVKNWHYLYLVENNRKNSAKRPSQKTLKYLGRIEKYSEEEISKIKELTKKNDLSIFDYILELKQKHNSKNKKGKENCIGDKCIICGFDIVTHKHHLVPVLEGGLFEKENLICLCPNHHEMLHKNLISREEINNYIKNANQ
jgi:predicted HNH restriction endonuclease